MRSARHQILIAPVVVIATAACGQVSIDSARFADNLKMQAPIATGIVDEVAQRVNLVIDSRTMKALDPQLSSDKRRKVQESILGPKVLDSERYPKITFESKKVQQVGQGRFLVRGSAWSHTLDLCQP